MNKRFWNLTWLRLAFSPCNSGQNSVAKLGCFDEMGEAQIRGNQVNNDLLFLIQKIKVKSCRAWFTPQRLSIDPNGIMVGKNIAYFLPVPYCSAHKRHFLYSYQWLRNKKTLLTTSMAKMTVPAQTRTLKSLPLRCMKALNFTWCSGRSFIFPLNSKEK